MNAIKRSPTLGIMAGMLVFAMPFVVVMVS